MDEGGKVVASGSEEHEAFPSPKPGWAEQDPRDWWRACGLAVRKALQSANLRAEDIACVGFSGQMHGAVLLDAKDEVVRSAIIWCDQRSEAQSNELEKLFGLETLIQLTCNPPLTNFTLTKLLWVRETEPENWARVAHVMLPKDYVRFRLTGERAIDMADASGHSSLGRDQSPLVDRGSQQVRRLTLDCCLHCTNRRKSAEKFRTQVPRPRV